MAEAFGCVYFGWMVAGGIAGVGAHCHCCAGKWSARFLSVDDIVSKHFHYKSTKMLIKNAGWTLAQDTHRDWTFRAHK